MSIRGIVMTLLLVVAVWFGFLALTGKPLPDFGLGKLQASETNDLHGRWQAVNYDTKMIAVIENDTITVQILGLKGHMIYWHGTYKEPSHGSFVSQIVKLDIPVLSTASTKEFVYEDGKISFSLTALGITRTIDMVRE